MSVYFQFVPLEEEIQNFFAPVARHIFKLLQGTPCIPVEPVKQESKALLTGEEEEKTNSESSRDAHWVLSCQAVFCPEDLRMVRTLVSPALLEKHLGLYYLHSGIASAINPALRTRLGIESLSSSHLIEIGKALSKKFSKDPGVQDTLGDEREVQGLSYSNIEWVANWLWIVYRCLNLEHESSQETLDRIASLAIIPLTDGSFVSLKADPVFFPLSVEKKVEGTWFFGYYLLLFYFVIIYFVIIIILS